MPWWPAMGELVPIGTQLQRVHDSLHVCSLPCDPCAGEQHDLCLARPVTAPELPGMLAGAELELAPPAWSWCACACDWDTP